MSKLLSVVLLCLSSQLAWAQAEKLSTWKEDEVPVGNKVHYVTFTSKHWVIEKVGPDIMVSRNKYRRGPTGDSLTVPPECLDPRLSWGWAKSVKKVAGGFLVGLNGGEGGGGLWFVSNDAGVQYPIESSRRIQRIFEFQSRLYAIHGLAHMTADYGGILELTRNAAGQWESNPLMDLAEAPTVTVVAADRVYILTTEHLGILNSDRTLTTVLRGPFRWAYLYPSSMVVATPDLYIGMRWGVLKIKNFESKPEYAWYISNSQ